MHRSAGTRWCVIWRGKVGCDTHAGQLANAVSCKGTAAPVLLPSCRRIARATGDVFAVKRLSPLHQSDFPFVLENEVTGLTYANHCSIPRVVMFKELIVLPDGGARMILE